VGGDLVSIPGRPVVILPGKRPPPPVPPDVEEIVRVLNGAAPKVCPACGRPWRAEAPCVCLEPEPVVSLWARLWRWLTAPWRPPEPVVSLWARLWRWLTAPWRPPEPRVVYDADLSRPTPPRPRVGKSTVSVLRTQDFTPPE
jgi:hypothetical protein